MISIKYAKERKLFLFLIFVFLAFLFHQSAFIFAPVYFLVNIPLTKRRYCVMLVIVSAVAFLSGQVILPLVLRFFHFNEEYHPIAFAFNKRLLLVAIFCLIAFLKTDFEKVKNDKNLTLLYWGTILTMGISVLGAYESLVSRAVDYYFVFFLLLIPDLLRYYNKRIQFCANIALYGSLLAFFYVEIAKSGLLI